MFESLSKYELDDFEYGKLVEDTDNNTELVKVILPKITPLINCAEPVSYLKSFNPNIFVNNLDSKPNITNNIRLRNYLEIKRFNGTYNRVYKKDETVICQMMNKDIRDFYLTDFIGGEQRV